MFPAYNLNFHWRWWDRIQAIFLNLFYFNCNWPAIINQSHLTNNFCLSTQCLCFLECRKCVSRTQSTGNFPSYFWLVRRWPSPCLLKLPKLYYYRQKVKRVVLDWLLCRKIKLIDGPHYVCRYNKYQDFFWCHYRLIFWVAKVPIS